MAKNKEKNEEQVTEIENKEKIEEQVKDIENKEENLIDTEEKQDKVVFKNPDFRAEEKEKVPPYFVEPPKKQKESDFGVKNGRLYKKVDEYHGLYTDTGEMFKLK